MIDWISNRFDDVRRRGVRDKGFVLVSTIMLFVLVAGSVYWMISAANRTIRSAVNSTDFVQSGQLADEAIQDALYQLNEVQPAALPTAAAPRTKGSGEDWSWQWYADPAVQGDGGPSRVLHATGMFRGVERKIQATAKAPRVGGYKVETDNSITYRVAPSTAFTHMVMGQSVTVTNGIGGADPFIAGSVGALGNTVNVAAAPGTSAQPEVSYFQYGPSGSARSLSGAVRAPAGLALEPQFITEYMGTCGGGAPEHWKASRHGGVLTANGNSGCFASMDFDVPTIIQGDGSFNAYVSGGVSIRQNISAASGTGLNIYTNGNAAFHTEEASGSSLTTKNVFVYAPKGLCSTPTAGGGYRSTSKSLDFTGSLACKTVQAAGEFNHADPIDPAGDDIFDNTVWYLADYQQPSGKSTR